MLLQCFPANEGSTHNTANQLASKRCAAPQMAATNVWLSPITKGFPRLVSCFISCCEKRHDLRRGATDASAATAARTPRPAAL
eukprot:6211982-Pleurochrysis_carterae.AAC.3